MSKSPRLTTGEVRFNFVHVFEPHSFENNPPKYSVMVLVPKSDTKTLAEIAKAIEAVKRSDKGKQNLKGVRGEVTFLRDGDEEKADQYPEFAGHYFFNTSSKDPVIVVDRNKQEILDPRAIYSGCYGRVSIDVFSYNSHGNRGVTTGLRAVQLLRDGEPLSGVSPVNVEAEFDDLDDDADIWG